MGVMFNSSKWSPLGFRQSYVCMLRSGGVPSKLLPHNLLDFFIGLPSSSAFIPMERI